MAEIPVLAIEGAEAGAVGGPAGVVAGAVGAVGYSIYQHYSDMVDDEVERAWNYVDDNFVTPAVEKMEDEIVQLKEREQSGLGFRAVKRRSDTPHPLKMSRRRVTQEATPLITDNDMKDEENTPAPILMLEAPINCGFGASRYSLFKMVYGMKRRKRFRRRSRRKRRRYVTKRGAKAMIARNAMFSGAWQKFRYCKGINIAGGFNTFGINSFMFNEIGAIDQLRTDLLKTIPIPPGTGGVNQPPSPKQFLAVRKQYVHMMIHSCTNEVQEVSVWQVIAKQDSASTYAPSVLWDAEWEQRDSASGRGDGVFETDHLTYPTEFKEWNDYWTIRKKWKFQLPPGKTVSIKTRFVAWQFQSLDSPNLQHVKGITEGFMFQMKGVPTQDATTPAEVGRSLTGIDVTMDKTMDAVIPSKNLTWLFADQDYGTIANAEVVNSSNANAMLNTI